ncbi:NAD(P)H-binding protein [Ornithinibacillus salinisoli]|uniref:NAD(P)H-binding protein n=1 Tax=Ornithinibacillus salinisoli TaxID=1848459 RepID=A0ABW4W570_9BACI
MRVLVLGASGATGKQVVRQLIKRQINTRILIRKSAVLSKDIQENPLVEIMKGNINELNDSEMNNLLRDCHVIISCLGHNVTPKGLFGKPRYLVFDAIKRISETAKKRADKRVKLILMSTTGYTNTLSREKNSMGEKVILSLLKLLLPPHRDNVKAANYLITEIGKEEEKVEWVVVRPDTLVNNDEESPYEVCESPVRSPIFNAGKTSRINVGHFMTELVTDDTIWKKWQFKTPVIYNKIETKNT